MVSDQMTVPRLPLNKKEAELLVKQYLTTLDPVEPDNPWVINYPHTEEFEWGWVFYFHNKRFLETRDFNYEVGGNAPVIVSKADGEMYSTGTLWGTEHYIGLFL